MKLHLNPEVLKWARTRAKVDIPTVAKKLRIKEARVHWWEKSGGITLSQATRLAKVTYCPFGYLWLDEIPHEADQFPKGFHDYRYDHDEPFPWENL